MSIEEKVSQFIKKYNLEDKPFLVAFSGGADSMCLLNVLKCICPNHITAIHLNHAWRGEESDAEEENCKNFCASIGVEFYCEKLGEDIPKTETAARNARYDFFEKCAERFNSDVIFTAHNKNDNVETVVFRICHGTGIPGLAGISEYRGMYYRPLLDISRDEIEAYCADKKLSPNHDSSNEDTVHQRNFIRKEVLPVLKQVNPNIMDTINSLSVSSCEDTEIVELYMKSVFEKIMCSNKIVTEKYLSLPKSVQLRVLYDIITPLVPQDYSRQRIVILNDFICANSYSKSGKTISVTNGYMLFVSDKLIEIIQSKSKNEEVIDVKSVGQYRFGDYVFELKQYDKSCDKGIKVDLSGIDFDFQLRTRKDGDVFYPLKGIGHQKLKKYLNSKKIPNHEKDEILFLASGKEILWGSLIGISDIIKAEKTPTHVIIFKRR